MPKRIDARTFRLRARAIVRALHQNASMRRELAEDTRCRALAGQQAPHRPATAASGFQQWLAFTCRWGAGIGQLQRHSEPQLAPAASKHHPTGQHPAGQASGRVVRGLLGHVR